MLRSIWSMAVLSPIIMLLSYNSHANENPTEKSSHISVFAYDVSIAKPITNLEVELYRLSSENDQQSWQIVNKGTTNSKGLINQLLEKTTHGKNYGTYHLKLITQPYFEKNQQPVFYPHIDVIFKIEDERHYAIPVKLSAFSYATYLGNW